MGGWARQSRTLRNGENVDDGVAGGYLIAFAEVTITYPLKKVLGYLLPETLAPAGLVQLLSTDYKFAVSFVILLIVLLFRPTGLFRGKAV